MESHLQTQRAAVKMLHDRILLLVRYVTEVIAGLYMRTTLLLIYGLRDWCMMPGTAKRDQATLRSLSALIASLPASENPEFRKEFETVCDF